MFLIDYRVERGLMKSPGLDCSQKTIEFLKSKRFIYLRQSQ